MWLGVKLVITVFSRATMNPIIAGIFLIDSLMCFFCEPALAAEAAERSALPSTPEWNTSVKRSTGISTTDQQNPSEHNAMLQIVRMYTSLDSGKLRPFIVFNVLARLAMFAPIQKVESTLLGICEITSFTRLWTSTLAEHFCVVCIAFP
mmetsp:Transcript_751/g.1314  ORF Transcript_751/g.1314 Transcript_751/m.1314 type:complete len:149 (-) Transcript_751:7-453(-)